MAYLEVCAAAQCILAGMVVFTLRDRQLLANTVDDMGSLWLTSVACEKGGHMAAEHRPVRLHHGTLMPSECMERVELQLRWLG